MSFNITDFKANGLIFDGARPSQFEVLVTPPAGLGVNIKNRIRFLVRAAELPGLELQTIMVPYFGRMEKVPGSRDYPPWSMTVMNDNDFAVRAMFEAWSNKMNAFTSNRMSDDVFPGGYTQDFIVRQKAPNGQIAREYTLLDGYPSSISPIRLDWADGNSIEYFDVRVEYSRWVPTDGLGIEGAAVDAINEGLLNPASVD